MIAQCSYRTHIMTYEKDGAALALAHVFHLTDGFFLELCIADGEDFVHYQYLRLQESRYGEAQTDSHTRAITFHRGVDISLTAGEIDDLVQLGLYLVPAHAEDGAVHEDILPTRHLPVESCADLQEASNSAMGSYGPSGGTSYT